MVEAVQHLGIVKFSDVVSSRLVDKTEMPAAQFRAKKKLREMMCMREC